MQPPSSAKEVQRLTGRIAALNRFISRSTDKCLPFYQLLKGNKKFTWDDKCEEAFIRLKEYLTEPPVLSKPAEGEPLYLYIAVSEVAVSGVLIREDRGEQKPIYYVSKSLVDAETRYPSMEKLALAVVVSARKLRPYFQSHSIVVMTTQPLRTILHSPSQSGRLAKWAIELSEYDIEYRPRTSAKAQVLADFVVELATPAAISKSSTKTWSLYVDGASSKQGAGVGIHLVSPANEVVEQSFRLGFTASNNEAEYEALIAGLRLATGIGIRNLSAFSDSQLITSQFHGEYEARDPRMESYLTLVHQLVKDFDVFSLTRIPRGENTIADALAALASTSNPLVKRVIPVEGIEKPSITIQKNDEDAMEIDVDSMEIDTILAPTDDLPPEQDEEEPEETNPEVISLREKMIARTDWRQPIIQYIEGGEAPPSKWEARKLKTIASRYCIIASRLYKRSISGPYLVCVHGLQAFEILSEVHGGSCGSHSAGRALAVRIKRQAYFWPTMVADCEEHSKACDKCQRHAPILHQPTENLSHISAPYPFMRWSMDIVGPMVTSGKRRCRFLLVLTDYFTKWIEAGAFQEIKAKHVEEFVWQNIVCRHGVPYEIVTDNGSQFISNQFTEFCEKYNIRLTTSTPRHPQGNGQAEAANKLILNNLKKRLDARKNKWSDELPGVLWACRTTPRKPTSQTPFSLAYGIEAVIPAEVAVPSLRVDVLTSNEELNNEMLSDELDFIDERRDQALINLQNYQHAAARYYNSNVKVRRFQLGELVLRKVYDNTKESNAGKLGTNWEGPYRISEIIKNGVYKLVRVHDERPERNSWNAMSLKKYYY